MPSCQCRPRAHPEVEDSVAALARHVCLKAPDRAEPRANAVRAAAAMAPLLSAGAQEQFVGFVFHLSRSTKVRRWAPRLVARAVGVLHRGAAAPRPQLPLGERRRTRWRAAQPSLPRQDCRSYRPLRPSTPAPPPHTPPDHPPLPCCRPGAGAAQGPAQPLHVCHLCRRDGRRRRDARRRRRVDGAGAVERRVPRGAAAPVRVRACVRACMCTQKATGAPYGPHEGTRAPLVASDRRAVRKPEDGCSLTCHARRPAAPLCSPPRCSDKSAVVRAKALSDLADVVATFGELLGYGVDSDQYCISERFVPALAGAARLQVGPRRGARRRRIAACVGNAGGGRSLRTRGRSGCWRQAVHSLTSKPRPPTPSP